MSTISKYVLVDREGVEQDYEYDSLADARSDAEKQGFAVIEREFEYSDSSLAWAPNGADVWPPVKVTPAEVVGQLAEHGFDASVETGPASTELVVNTETRSYGFMLYDDDQTAPACGWDAAGPFESGPVFDALDDYEPAKPDGADTAADIALEIGRVVQKAEKENA